MSTNERSSVRNKIPASGGPAMPHLVGHEDKMSAFMKLAAAGTLGHAYLFFGDVEIGKSRFAEAFGEYLETGKFERTERSLIDTVRIAPNEKGVIGIDSVRDIRKFLWQTPLISIRRFALVDGADALTDEAQSALLKIVEEPSPHALLIFIAYNPDVLFAPLRSRLSKVYFSRLPRAAIQESLVKYLSIPERQAASIAERSFGRMGRALRLLGGGEDPVPSSDELSAELDATIIRLRDENETANARTIKWLIERAVASKRYNVNPNLQRRAIQAVLKET